MAQQQASGYQPPEVERPALSAVFAVGKDVAGAVDQLQERGFALEDISVLYRNVDPETVPGVEEHTKSSEGATIGAVIGVLAGGALGWMTGAGYFSLPGTGLLIAAGPLLGMLAAAGVTGIAGGIVGALVGLGISEYEAKGYVEEIEEGAIFVNVLAETKRERRIAREIFERFRAQKIFHLTADSNGEESEFSAHDTAHKQ